MKRKRSVSPSEFDMFTCEDGEWVAFSEAMAEIALRDKKISDLEMDAAIAQIVIKQLHEDAAVWGEKEKTHAAWAAQMIGINSCNYDAWKRESQRADELARSVGELKACLALAEARVNRTLLAQDRAAAEERRMVSQPHQPERRAGMQLEPVQVHAHDWVESITLGMPEKKVCCTCGVVVYPATLL